MLELAFWIGPYPGTWSRYTDQELELWRYRDLRVQGRQNAGQRDRWVVFHIHFDETRPLFWDFNGHTYMGTVSFFFFFFVFFFF